MTMVTTVGDAMAWSKDFTLEDEFRLITSGDEDLRVSVRVILFDEKPVGFLVEKGIENKIMGVVEVNGPSAPWDVVGEADINEPDDIDALGRKVIAKHLVLTGRA
jgi:hypothetical protein